jgi:uncharacterized coiled-coil protein SlyX
MQFIRKTGSVQDQKKIQYLESQLAEQANTITELQANNERTEEAVQELILATLGGDE